MTRDLKRIQLRRTVTRQLDQFFTAWLEHLATGSARIWARVERALDDAATHGREGANGPTDLQTSPPMRVPMQQQPVQQQQKKKEDEGE
jgi:hypothetical protein